MSKPLVRLIAHDSGYLLVADLQHVKQIRALLGNFEEHSAHKHCSPYTAHCSDPKGGWDVRVYRRYVQASVRLVAGKLSPKFDVKLCAGDANPHEDDGRKSMDRDEWAHYLEDRLSQRR